MRQVQRQVLVPVRLWKGGLFGAWYVPCRPSTVPSQKFAAPMLLLLTVLHSMWVTRGR